MNETNCVDARLTEALTTADISDEALLSHLISLLSHCTEDPIEGLAGYLVTEDPTYLPDDTEIKRLIRIMGRDKLLRMILGRVLPHHQPPKGV